MILFRYILKNHIAPFFFSIFTLISIFLLQLLMKFADKLVGKGLSFWVILKFIIYNLAWIVVLVVPMSVLVATLMAFGAMAQNNEVAIMKASGISLYKMTLPPILASILIALFLIYFNNNIYPDANHAAAAIIKDINRTKPTLALVPGVFSQDVDNFSILARTIDKDTLRDLTIYDNSNPRESHIITAKKGKIFFSKDQKKLILSLWSGEIHQLDLTDRERYQILEFKQHRIAMDAEDFSFNQSSFGGQRGFREMGAPELMRRLDSLKAIDNASKAQYESANKFYFYNPLPNNGYGSIGPNPTPDLLYIKVREKINSAKAAIESRISSLSYRYEDMNTYRVEINKKYSIPVACIIFVLIGAPLGTMTRKGGFGVAAGISLTFFLIYWACLIGGEKLAIRGIISPFTGMWGANIIMGAFGVFVLIKSAKEKVELNFDWMKKLLPKQLRIFSEQNENS